MFESAAVLRSVLFKKCIGHVETCFKDANIVKKSVDEVVLVGVSIRPKEGFYIARYWLALLIIRLVLLVVFGAARRLKLLVLRLCCCYEPRRLMLLVIY